MATDTRKEMMQDRARTSYKREKKNKKKKDNIPSNEIQRNSKISIVRDRIVIIRTDFSEFGQYRGDSRLGLANSIATFV